MHAKHYQCLIYNNHYLHELSKIRTKSHFKIELSAPADVAQWIEHWPVNQRVTGSIPNQGTCPGYRPGPQQGGCERQPHTDVSLPLSLPPFSSL